MPLANGQVFAGYTVLRLLGFGGMGEVYLAQHPRLPKRVALKILPTDVSSNEDFRRRFQREAALAAELQHPHIVGVHDRGEFDGQLWISMDFVDGFDASRRLVHNYPSGMPLELVVRIVTAVASALDYAHKKDLLHRDVKPANIMLSHTDDDGEQWILLTDFGIARKVGDIGWLTATDMVVGTVAYAAPEQLMGGKIDGRADQYALAATAFHLLTGSLLFPHSNPVVVANRHINAPPPKLGDTRPALAALDHVLARALAKNPHDRFPRCGDFARGLASQCDGMEGMPDFLDLEPPARSPGPTPPRGGASPKSSRKNRDRAVQIRRRGRRLLGYGTIAIAVSALVWGVLHVHPWQRVESGTRPTSKSASPAPSITFDGMREFVEGYYADLPGHPEAAWAKLDDHYKQQTGFTEFSEFWATIQSVTVISVSPRDATSVVARLMYVRRSGKSDTEDRWFKMVLVNGNQAPREACSNADYEAHRNGCVNALMLLDESERTTTEPAATRDTTQLVTAVAVDADGKPINGYREGPTSSSYTTVESCDYPSVAAVSDHVYSCGPIAAEADICWPGPPDSMFCLVDADPWSKILRRFSYDTSTLRTVKPYAKAHPFALLLDDGTRCRRVNSPRSFAQRDDGFFATYTCGVAGGVLAPVPNAALPNGGPDIDRSRPLWTVKVGGVGGRCDLGPCAHFSAPDTHTVTSAWVAAN
ncbi:serine/threonine-protein kinase [Mycobacterium alsense]|uniref:serine/threonine-protein kinase n=1 Tax=Mycobacterium alsense TaxID=324058 RepID=UPI0009F2E5CC|nr:serine/threonine-protein kinase [Mycobacterium alsense]